jgi:hypothetical protein
VKFIMKKLIAAVVALIMTSSVFAEDIKKDSMYYLEFEYSEGVESKGIAAGFDENNLLVSAALCDIIIGDKICSAEFDMDLPENGKNIRIYFPRTQKTVKTFTLIENPGELSDNSGEEPGKEPDKEPSEEENNTSAVNRYPTELDAATAFMFVKDVSEVVENDEIKTKLTVFFRGEETEIYVDDDIKLASAPVINSELTDSSVSALQKGDVIYCSTNLSGKLRTVELVYRPYDGDIIMQEENFGENFENLFSLGNTVTTVRSTPIAVYGSNNSLRQQYAFGLIKERKDSRYMTLCNKNGKSAQDITIDLTPDTVVYVYDNSKRNKLYIGTVGDIEKSEFDSMSVDEDDNIINWSDDCLHNYALVRMAEGTALDVAVYLNY